MHRAISSLLLAGALGLATAACERTPAPNAPAAIAQVEPPKTAAAPPTAASQEAKPPERTLDLHDLTVRTYANGHIILTGKDRWGNAVDTTYEDATFLRNALPTLARSLSPEQLTGLRQTFGPSRAPEQADQPTPLLPPPTAPTRQN